MLLRIWQSLAMRHTCCVLLLAHWPSEKTAWWPVPSPGHHGPETAPAMGESYHCLHRGAYGYLQAPGILVKRRPALAEDGCAYTHSKQNCAMA